MNAFLLAVTITFASFNNILLRKAGIKYKEKDDFLFNAICSVIWIIILLVPDGEKISFSGATIMYGILYGIVQTLFLYFKTKSLQTGEISVTTLTGNCSLIISTVLGTLIWHEKFSVYQAIGVALLLFSIFMCTFKSGVKKYEKSWKYFVSLFFLCAGMIGIIFKSFSKTIGSEYAKEMMIVAAIIMFLLNSAIALINNKQTKKIYISKSEAAYAAACGVLSCVYNKLNIFYQEHCQALFFSRYSTEP